MMVWAGSANISDIATNPSETVFGTTDTCFDLRLMIHVDTYTTTETASTRCDENGSPRLAAYTVGIGFVTSITMTGGTTVSTRSIRHRME